MQDYDVNEFLPPDDRIKGDLLEEWGWDGVPVTIASFGQKTYPARDDKPEEKKLQVFFRELPGWALECNSRQLRKLKELFGNHTGVWVGRQVCLVSTDGGVFNGQPCKTITVKEVRTAAPAAPGQPSAPTASAPVASAAPARPALTLSELPPPDDDISPDDPFADDPATPQQLEEIDALCKATRRNTVNTCQRLFAVNPDQLTYEQATAFLMQLKKEMGKTREAVIA